MCYHFRQKRRKQNISSTSEHFSFSLETSEIIIDSGASTLFYFLSLFFVGSLSFYVQMTDILLFCNKITKHWAFSSFWQVFEFPFFPHLVGSISIINAKQKVCVHKWQFKYASFFHFSPHILIQNLFNLAKLQHS